jgi:hypothetical protein
MAETEPPKVEKSWESSMAGDAAESGPRRPQPTVGDPPLIGEDPAATPRPRESMLAPLLVVVTFMVLAPPACYLAGIFHMILTGQLQRSAFEPGLMLLALQLGAGFLALGLYWALGCGIVEALYRSRSHPASGEPPLLSGRPKSLLCGVLVVLLFASPAVSYGVSGALYTSLDLWGVIAAGVTSIAAVSVFTAIESFTLGAYWYAAIRLVAYARRG